jgi:hypothetical protein
MTSGAMSMQGRRVFLFTVLFVGLLGVPAAASADDAPIAGVPGSVRPVNAGSVRMESEAVQIIVYDGTAECRADFRLVNSGKKTTLRLAFPSVTSAVNTGDPWNPDNFGDFLGYWPPIDEREYPPEMLGAFHAWRNGRPLPVKVVQGHDGPLGAVFYEHSVTLPTGATTVTVSYLFDTDHMYARASEPSTLPPAPLRWLYMAGGFASVDYILHTGALWSGTIGTAVVRVTFDDSCQRWGTDILAANPTITTPGWTKPDARTFQWVFRDFEPAQDAASGRSAYDIRVGFVQPLWEPIDYYEQYDAAQAAAALNGDAADDFEPTSRWQRFWQRSFISDVDQSLPAQDMSRYEFTPFGDTWTPFWTPPSAAWAVRGNGTRTWFSAILRGPERVRELRIVPGLADATYRDYSRPRTIVATFSDGSRTTLHIADDPRMQRFPVDVVTGSIRFRVSAVYRGTKDPAIIAVALADAGPTPSPKWLSFAAALRLANP